MPATQRAFTFCQVDATFTGAEQVIMILGDACTWHRAVQAASDESAVRQGGAGTHRVGGRGGVHHVQVLLPGHIQQVGGQALSQCHHGQAPYLW